MQKRTVLVIFFSLVISGILLVVLAFSIPAIRERIVWRLDEWRVRIDYALNPPEEAVFVPEAQIAASPTGLPEPTATLQPTAVTLQPTDPAVTATPLPPSPTPLPQQISLEGIRYQDQHGLWNYCAPANLAMGLSYWGWEGDRLDAGEVLKPFEKDKNVMPYEMADYVNEHTDYRALVRSGGNIALLKRLIASGFPVIAEKGVFIRDLTGKVSWMGHYAVLNGYDDAAGHFITQDSYFQPDYPVTYDEIVSQWRSFNYVFIVIYSPDREAELMEVLDEYADDAQADRIAYELASQEIYELSGMDQFFAWFNRGTSMVYLQDYTGAAEAYDRAFQIYASLPENDRPWRMMWYQTGPYFAYYHAARYQDVVNLATLTIDSATEPYLEENFYWRALAYVALGQNQNAIADLQQSLEYHPNFVPSVQLLNQLGVSP